MRYPRLIPQTFALFLCILAGCTGTWRIDPAKVTVVAGEQESAPVMLAVETLCRDFEKVTGVRPEVVPSEEAVPAGHTALVVANRETAGDGTEMLPVLGGYESHRVKAERKDRRIWLTGADMRGTIYAIYTFDEKVLGVPPLWYWCSWVPEHKARLQLPADMDFFLDSPQVRFRSWLPNDSDLWSVWIRKSPENREAIYETMLRLKLNTLECGGLGYPGIPGPMTLCQKYGLVVTSHHIYMLNTTFSSWDRYWKGVKGLSKSPELSIKDIDSLTEFWEYGARTVQESGVENIWNISFRGSGDQPFWILFKDAPNTEAERGAVINSMLQRQMEIIHKYDSRPDPFVRMTFYDEMADLVNSGLVTPPQGENMIWTFCSGRRDHYPYDDIQAFNPSTPVSLGYYMNLQFTSTGAHLAPAEGPWKMEFNYRYVDTKSPLCLSVVNSGNFREFLYTMSANASLLWDMSAYDTDRWNRSYAAQYFGEEHADEVAALYKDYFYAYWTQKKPDFPGGMERQFIFQDQRHTRAIHYIFETFFDYNANPLPDRFGYERVPGRVFRVTPEDCGVANQVDAILKGMTGEEAAFADVADRATALMQRLPADKRPFFYDNLLAYALYMQHLSACLYHYTSAYKNQHDVTAAAQSLDKAYDEMLSAREALKVSERGVFEGWYDADRILGMQRTLDEIDETRKKLNP